MFLTKMPEKYIEHVWPQNCWLGATVEHTSSFGHIVRLSEIRTMADMGNHKTFLSIEPILGSFQGLRLDSFDLLIIGADKKPEREWVDSVKHPNIWYKQNIIKYYPDLKNNT